MHNLPGESPIPSLLFYFAFQLVRNEAGPVGNWLDLLDNKRQGYMGRQWPEEGHSILPYSSGSGERDWDSILRI